MTFSPEFPRPAHRGSQLRLGEYLHASSLTSPSGRFTLVNTVDATTLYDHASGEPLWAASSENVYGQAILALGLDGDLTVWNHHRRPGWRSGTAGLGTQQLQVTDEGDVILIDGDGQVLWTTNTAPARATPGAVIWPTPAGPDPSAGPAWSEATLAVCFDSLATGRGYTAVVVRDLTPAEALRRWGLDEASTATWQELASRSTNDEIAVAAVPLDGHTLLVAGTAWVQGGDQLSAGTTAVRHSYDPQRAWPSEWSMHRDGATIAHVREEPPKRRKGVNRPEIRQAVEEMNEHQSWSAPDWFASFRSLELMCRVAGVRPTAADLRGPLLGGVVPASLAQPPVLVRPPRPDRPPLVIEDDLVLVRTDFSDDVAWAAILAEVRTGGFDEQAVQPTDDPGWQGADFEEVLAALPDGCAPDVVYLADAVAMAHPDHALLAASTELPPASDDYEPEDGVTRTLRIEPGLVTTMHANLQVANLSWEEYCEQLDDPQTDVLPAW
jgi:hypothetical protein